MMAAERILIWLRVRLVLRSRISNMASPRGACFFAASGTTRLLLRRLQRLFNGRGGRQACEDAGHVCVVGEIGSTALQHFSRRQPGRHGGWRPCRPRASLAAERERDESQEDACRLNPMYRVVQALDLRNAFA